MEKLLLHQCCAPCSAGSVPEFGKEFALAGFWHNPNIHPAEEHAKRLASLERFDAANGIALHRAEETGEEEWTALAGMAGGDRCSFCYALRMSKAAAAAKELGIGRFSTTLLSSPFQKHEMVRSAGERAARENGVEFVYRDLRRGYFGGKDSAKRGGYYIQRYCGCRFSKAEREKGK